MQGHYQAPVHPYLTRQWVDCYVSWGHTPLSANARLSFMRLNFRSVSNISIKRCAKAIGLAAKFNCQATTLSSTDRAFGA